MLVVVVGGIEMQFGFYVHYMKPISRVAIHELIDIPTAQRSNVDTLKILEILFLERISNFIAYSYLKGVTRRYSAYWAQAGDLCGENPHPTRSCSNLVVTWSLTFYS